MAGGEGVTPVETDIDPYLILLIKAFILFVSPIAGMILAIVTPVP